MPHLASRMAPWLNPGWDNELAERRIGQLSLDPKQKAGKLSGGQRAQLALTLAIAKRPQLLLDEPIASLDPLALAPRHGHRRLRRRRRRRGV